MASLLARGLSISSLQQGRFSLPTNALLARTGAGGLLEARTHARQLSWTPAAKMQAEATKPSSPQGKPLTEEIQRNILSQLSYRLSGKTAKVTNLLFARAVHSNNLQAVEKDVKWLLQKFEQSRSAKNALRDRSTSAAALAKLQQEGKLQPLTVAFLKYLDEKRLMAELSNMMSNFLSMCMDYRKEAEIKLVLPPKFKPTDEKVLVKVLQKLYLPKGTKPVITKTVDPKMQGFVANVGGYSVDASRESSFRLRDRQITDWVSSVRGGIEDMNEQIPKRESWVRSTINHAIQYLTERSQSAPSSKLSKVLTKVKTFRKVLSAANYFKTKVSLHAVMDTYLSFVHASLNKGAAPAITWTNKKLNQEQVLKRIKLRVRLNPESEGWMYQVKMRSWKDEERKLRPNDPLRKTYEQVIKNLEASCGKVSYKPPEPSEEPYSFERLSKLSLPELLKVPVEELQKLSKEDLAQLPLRKNKEQILKELGFQPIDVEQVRSVDLSKLQRVDIDVICMDINEQIRIYLNAKRFALQRHFNNANRTQSKRQDEVDQFIRANDSKSVAEINKEFGLRLDPSLDTKLSQLYGLKQEVEAKVKALGITPIPDRLNW